MCEPEGSRFATDELLTFRSTWKNSNLSAKKKLELLKSFFRFCAAAKLTSSNPAEGIKPPKVEEKQVMPFTDEEMELILEACDQHLPGGERIAQCKCVRWFC